MNRIEVNVDANPEIIVERVGRSLHVKSWDRSQIRMDFLDPGDTYEEKDLRFTINTHSDCLIRVPPNSEMKIVSVRGDAHITGIEGALSIQQVGGSLTLKRVSAAEIENVSGNLGARDISGSLEIQNVGGNASFKNVKGEIEAINIRGNLDIKNGGSRIETRVGGNANISSAISEDATYEIECGGNAYCRIEHAQNLAAEFESGAERILIQTEDTNQSMATKKHEVRLGDGSAKLAVKAGGHIDFRTQDKSGFHLGFDFELDDDFNVMVDEISDQVSIQMEAQLESLSDQLESLSEQMQVSGDHAIKLAQRKVEDAQRQLEKRMRARGGKAVRRPSVPHPFGSSQTAEAVSEVERMKVLEMVQQKKISVDEAELLLATLEGREPKKEARKEASAEKDEE